MKVGRCFVSSILLLQLFIFPSFVEARKCITGGLCGPTAEFDYKTFEVGPRYSKECGDDACAMYWCLLDGKIIFHGFGCYSDYVRVCGDVSNNAKIDVKNMVLNDQKEGDNVKVFVCKPDGKDEGCASEQFQHEVDNGAEFFSSKFINGANMSYDSYDGECVFPRDTNESDVMNQLDSFSSFVITSIGLLIFFCLLILFYDL